MLNDKMIYGILLLIVTIHGKETDYGSNKYEYMEVFNNIPRMFEYFLNRIAEKPEMLEKDDITVFIKSANVNHRDYGKEKRNVYCETGQLTGATNHEVKREIDLLDELKCSQSKRETDLNDGSKLNQLSDEEIEIKKTVQKERNTNIKLKNVYQYCYNNGVFSNCTTDTNIKKNTVNPSYHLNTNIQTPGKQYNFLQKRNSDSKKSFLKKYKNSIDRLNKRFKKVETKKGDIGYLITKNSKNHRRRSSAADFEVSHLSPEEIEDAAILMEQMLEDYNNKQSEEVE